MGKIKVARVPDISHEQWLELRRTGIGGSDAATIVGLNPYSSRYALYLDKIGELPPKEDNEAMRIGRDLEAYVAQRFCEATGKKVQRNNFMWRSEEHPFMLADIDREIVGENACLECKTTSAYNKHDFENGQIPLAWYSQILHYIYTMGYDHAYLSVVVLGKGYWWFRIERDDDEIAALIEQEEAFWKLVQERTPPAPDGSDATDAAIRARYPADGVTDMPAELTDKSLAMLHTIEELDAQIKELTTARKAAQAVVEEEMGACAYGSVGEFSVSWKAQSRTAIDSKRLKKEQPEVWEQYSKTTESRVFKVKRREVDAE